MVEKELVFWYPVYIVRIENHNKSYGGINIHEGTILILFLYKTSGIPEGRTRSTGRYAAQWRMDLLPSLPVSRPGPKDIPQMPHPIPDRTQMAPAFPMVTAQYRRYLTDRYTRSGKSGDHFRCELHSRAVQGQSKRRFSVKCTQAAVKIPNGRMKPQSCQTRQKRYADPVGERHGTGGDTAGKTVPHHQPVSLPQCIHKRIRMAEIVTAVCVSHENIPPFRRRNPTQQSRTISLLRYGNNPGTVSGSDIRRTVRRTVVSDQDLRIQTKPFDPRLRFAYAERKGRRFVETGHQYREFLRLGLICWGESLRWNVFRPCSKSLHRFPFFLPGRAMFSRSAVSRAKMGADRAR